MQLSADSPLHQQVDINYYLDTESPRRSYTYLEPSNPTSYLECLQQARDAICPIEQEHGTSRQTAYEYETRRQTGQARGTSRQTEQERGISRQTEQARGTSGQTEREYGTSRQTENETVLHVIGEPEVQSFDDEPDQHYAIPLLLTKREQ